MSGWIPIIKYAEFYDVPRSVLIRFRGRLVFLESRFIEADDEYEDVYHAYLLPDLSPEDIWTQGTRIAAIAERHVGDVTIEAATFDSTRRREIRAEALAQLEFSE